MAQYRCEHCAELREHYSNKDYTPRLCGPCYRAGVRSGPVSERVISEWTRDESGNLSRTLEGGA